MIQKLYRYLQIPAVLMFAAIGRASLPGPVVPDGLGVNIHFTSPRPGEMRMLASSGLTWVRMDLLWAATEKSRGHYDFTPWDRLVAAVGHYHMHAMFILDYGNPLYTGSSGHFPVSNIQRAAFTRWAAAAASHFAHAPVIFEMYNEPNGMGHATPEQYATLALQVGQAIHRINPAATYIGPALSGMDDRWLVPSLKAGLLKQWAGVSMHPYRQGPPETVTADYQKLSRMLAPYQPKGRVVPIVSGEWGYSTTWMHGNESEQGKYLAREFLTNLADGIPLSIWYDWHDDGTDKNPQERHFGMVKFKYHADRGKVYTPKPAFIACQTLVAQLRGLRFVKRIAVGGPADYLLLFGGTHRRVWVAWTTVSGSPKSSQAVRLPLREGRYRCVDYLGKVMWSATAISTGLPVRLSTGPIYISGVHHR